MSDSSLVNTSSGAVTVIHREFTETLDTGDTYRAQRLSQLASIETLKTIYASIKLTAVSVVVQQVWQATDAADGPVRPSGQVFFTLIPSGKNNNASVGATPELILGVKRKVPLPLSGNKQVVVNAAFDLKGYELDLAQDPRRQASPCTWIAHTGIEGVGDEDQDICTANWKFTVECSGESVSWE